jgi:hypothetical protein
LDHFFRVAAPITAFVWDKKAACAIRSRNFLAVGETDDLLLLFEDTLVDLLQHPRLNVDNEMFVLRVALHVWPVDVLRMCSRPH